VNRLSLDRVVLGKVRRAATIDIGTNTVKLAVGQVDDNNEFHLLKDASVGARLGEGLDASGLLDADAQERAVRAVGKHLAMAYSLNTQEISLGATAAVRDAKNGPDFLARLKSEYDCDVRVITGEEEGAYAYRAVALDPALSQFDSSQVTVDVGGGSTEFTFGCGRSIHSTISIRLGAVRLTERYLPFETPNSRQISEAAAFVDGRLAALEQLPDIQRIVGIGGSVVNLARIWNEVPPDKTEEVHATALTEDNLAQLVEGMCALSPDKRKTLIGLDPDRADIIVAGAVILWRVLRFFEKDQMTVSIMGFRHGLLYEMLKIGADEK